MIISRDVRITLGPRYLQGSIPYAEILRNWQQAEFDAEKCRNILERMIRNRALNEEEFNLDAFATGGFILTDDVLFPKFDAWKFILDQTQGDLERESVDFHARILEPAQVRIFADFLRWALHTENKELLAERLSKIGIPSPEKLIRPAPSRQTWSEPVTPGIYRREHASLLIRSNTTSILLDPISLEIALPGIDQIPLRNPTPVDAVVISHLHGDHWHLPSILYSSTDSNTPLIVPQVPRVNILTPENPADSLRTIGQTVKDPAWGETVTIGDIEIDILPFYGEQPTRVSPGAGPGLRSYGNCFRLNTPDFSALVLIDSGADPDGDMVSVIRDSTAKRGPADVVLSCMREFSSPFFSGLEAHWCALSFADLKTQFELYRKGKLLPTTAGPQGIAEICAAAQASYYLPYASGFEGVGKEITDIGWGSGEPSERAALKEVSDELKKAKLKTKAVPWNPGDRAVFNESKMSIRADLLRSPN